MREPHIFQLTVAALDSIPFGIINRLDRIDLFDFQLKTIVRSLHNIVDYKPIQSIDCVRILLKFDDVAVVMSAIDDTYVDTSLL